MTNTKQVQFIGFPQLRFFLALCILLTQIQCAFSVPHRDLPLPCDVLEHPDYGNFFCNNRNEHRSICHFLCSIDGFSTCPRSPTIWRCDNGTWVGSGEGQPTCCDDTPPTMTCPLSRVVYADREAVSANVSWNIPEVYDNSESDIVPHGSRVPGSRFHEGLHVIRYNATDAANNRRSCSFTIEVKVIRCVILTSPIPLGMSCSNGNIFGSVCSFQCPYDHGLCIRGANATVCENYGNNTHPRPRWTNPKPTCQFKQCSELYAPLNGHILGGCTRHFNSRCEMACDLGFSVVGGNTERQCFVQEESTCGTLGRWSGQELSCQAGPQFPPSRRTTVLAGYQNTVAALDYNTWEPVRATDVLTNEQIDASLVSINPPVDEIRPTSLPEGIYIFTYEAGDSAGNVTSWTLELIVRVIRCPELNIESYDGVSCSHGYRYGSVCSLSCSTSRCLTGSHVISCLKSGFWDYDVTTCQNVRCPEFNTPLNGYINGPEGQCRTEYESVCSVTCNDGYTSFRGIGDYPIQCVRLHQQRSSCDSAHWSGTMLCIDIDPPVFSDSLVSTITILPGDVDYTLWEPVYAVDSTSPSSLITATLISRIPRMPLDDLKPSILTEGTYTLDYEAVDMAGNKNTWVLALEVTDVRCTSPAPIQNGQIICPSTDYTIGTSCTIQCSTGYCLEDSTDTMECIRGGGSTLQDNAHWDVRQPTCRSYTYTTCLDLVAPSNGYLITGSCSSNYGSSCEVACREGYQLVGESVRHCTIRQGEMCYATFWSGDEPRCQVSRCPSLREVLPAFHTGCNKYPGTDEVGASCQWHCAPGYLGIGTTTSNCLADGTWDITDFVCEDVRCPVPEPIQNGQIICESTNHIIGTSCRIQCNTGYCLASDTNTMECVGGENSHWDVRHQTCREITCIDLVAPSNGYITSRSCLSNYGSSCEVACNEGYQLVGESVRHCSMPTAGEMCNAAFWSGDEPRCQVRRCHPVPHVLPAHGVMDTREPCDNSYGGSCSITCEDGYMLHGIKLVTCEYNSDEDYTYWTAPQATCERMNIQPPRLINCHRQTITAELSPVTLTAEVHFSIPEASTDSDQTLQLEKTPDDITSPYYFDANTTVPTIVRYEFSNEAGQSSTCSFQVIVQNNLPPTIICPSSPNARSWQIPEARNPVTNESIASWCDRQPDDDFGTGTHRITCSATNPDNQVSDSCNFYVTVPVSCPVLAPPKNGIFRCRDNTCGITCNTGHDILYGKPTALTCGDRGWQPTSQVPDCKPVRPFQIRQDIIMKSTGDCTADTTQQGVRQQVADFVKSISVEEQCLDKACSNYVVVTCQESLVARRNRSDDLPVMETRIKTFLDMLVETQEPSIWSLSTFIESNIMSQGFQPIINGLSFEPLLIDGQPCQIIDPKQDCQPGEALAASEVACVPCDAGETCTPTE